jgi:hypothetical protein
MGWQAGLHVGEDFHDRDAIRGTETGTRSTEIASVGRTETLFDGPFSAVADAYQKPNCRLIGATEASWHLVARPVRG